jgi:glycosyltransferase involved in cell wall biosynthesis
VRVPRLARELRESAQEAELRIHPGPKGFDGLDLAHVFNCWAPRSALGLLRRAKEAGIATAFSPIFLGIAERDLWEDRLAAILAAEAPGAATESALAGFRAELAARRAEPALGEAAPGFHAAVREMCGLADHLVLLSERERDRLAAIGALVGSASIVHNPVDAGVFADADPALFRRHAGVEDFVLCVARIEPRKNQAVLAHALRDTGLPLVLVGHCANEPYRALVEKHGGPGLRILDRLPPNSPLLASAFAAARVAVLPSWSEGAPLAALEAAAAGASLVLSDLSGESEYFGDRARYCDPADPASIRAAVLAAWQAPPTAEQVADQKAFVAETYSWDRHRAETQAAYGRALAAARAHAALPRHAGTPRPADRRVPVVFDVTTSAHHSGRWTGIARVEAALAIALHADPRADVRFVTWNNKARGFFEVPFEAIKAGRLNRLLAHYDTATPPPLRLPEGAHHVVPGSAWMQNSVYAESVVAFSKRHGLRLTPVIHDIIPTKFPFWFNDGYSPVFELNLATLLDGAAHVVAVSQATRRDVLANAAGVQDLAVPDVSVLREGDEISQIAHPDAAEATVAIAERFGKRPFVLTVGAIHLRKNHRLLYDVWLKLVERMGPRCPQLVLVGGVAWNGHEVARAFNGDPRLKDHVVILEGVDDHALDWLYRHCIFTVYPSLYEGWGLPVGESLHYGKLCIAADTSSVPEIAPGLVELVDPVDVMGWVTKVQFYAGSASARAAAEARIAREHAGFTWGQSAAQLLDILAAAEALPRRTPPYTYGVAVEFGDRFAASRIRGAGWHPCERWGCWTRDTAAELVFTPAAPPDEALLLVMEARALSIPGAPFEARILANGEPVARWMLRNGSLQVLHAVIPAEVARRAPSLRITIENGFVVPLRVAAKTEDPRLVGLGVARALLAPLGSLRDAATAFGAPQPVSHRVSLGRSYVMLAEGVARDVLGRDWAMNAAWGMTSTEQRPRMDLLVQELPGRDLDILLRLRPVATPAAPLLLLALVNGEQAGAFTFDSDAPVDVRIPVSADARARGEPMQLDLVPADARAPKTLGLGAAQDGFGFGLLALELRPAGTSVPRARIALATGDTWHPGAGARAMLGADWHAPEASGVWSFGPRAVLPLRLPGAASGTMLRIMLEAFRPAPGAEDLGLEIGVGDRVLASRRLGPHEAAQFALPIPAGTCRPGDELDLWFAAEAAPSPLVAGTGSDERPLGIRLSSVERIVAPELAAGIVARFVTEPDGTPAATAGAALQGEWFPPEPGGTWSKGEAGKLLLTPSAGLPAGWRAFALLRVFNAPAVVDMELDGAPLDTWSFETDNIFVAELRGLSDRIGAVGMLAFRRRGALSPRDAGKGADNRLLGVMLLGLVALPPDETERRAAELFAEAGLGKHRPLALATAQPPAAPPALVSHAFDFSVARHPGLRLYKWHGAEPEGRWSHGDYAEIYLAPPPGRATTLQIGLAARIHGTGITGPARVELRLETGPAQWLDFPDDDFRRHAVEFDVANLDYDGGEVCLWLRRPGALSPAEAGEGEDDRQLGILVRALDVVWR